MTLKVTATAKGYYGNKYRLAGEPFEIADKKAFSKEWMAPDGWNPDGDPLDHDDDGKKGGSRSPERDELKKQADELGVEYAANISTEKLRGLIDVKLSAPAELTDAEKIAKAKELSGRTDIETVEQASEILNASNTV